MKFHWFGLVVGVVIYILAIVPRLLLHRADMVFMILSGLLVTSFSFIGIDLPFPRKKLAVSLLMIGSLVLLVGVLLAIIGHSYPLFIIAVPALGLASFGLRQLLDEKERDETR